MVLFNYKRREITGKIVYYGPGLCGKTTNLQFIHNSVDPTDRGKMVSLATDADRTLFFDFMPIDAGYIKGMKIKFQFYTVPGQVHYNETRKMVLRGADAVVFVADSQKSLQDSNIYSYENMIENLNENGLDYKTIPLIIQYNKRDVKDIISIQELQNKLNERNVPFFEAIAINGQGVMETFREIGKLLLIDIGKKYKVEVTSERDIRPQKDKKKVKITSKTVAKKSSTKKTSKKTTRPDDKNQGITIEEQPEHKTLELDLDEDDLVLELDGTNGDNTSFITSDSSTQKANSVKSTHIKPKSISKTNVSVKQIEFQMDLKIILQRLKKITEENFKMVERQTNIMRQLEEIKEEFNRLRKK